MKQYALSFLLLIICLPGMLYAQKSYKDLVKDGLKYYYDSLYAQSAATFSQAFALYKDSIKPDDEYNAACSWALAGNKDSAFSLLNRITQTNYSPYNHIMIDADLHSLHDDSRWLPFVDAIRSNRDKLANKSGKLDEKLVAILDTVYQDDQAMRLAIEPLMKKYPPDSKEMKDIWKVITAKDSVDLIKVEHILDTRGWLGPDVVGREGNTTLFLVIQHSGIEVQEKYLPMMRRAVKEKKASPGSFALLEDRVALREGKKQIYGSQIFEDGDGKRWVSPLEDPDNVDKRRAEVGLGPIADYLKNWGMVWDADAYKKALPEIEAKEKGRH